jgi:hypothetical protein
MVIPRVQFNPSTLKASYVAANNTVQIYNPVPCEHCSPFETPGSISVTLSANGDCADTCYVRIGDSVKAFGSNIGPTLDGTHILHQSDSAPCLYVVDLPISSTGYYYWVGNTTCSGGATGTRTYTFLRLELFVEDDPWQGQNDDVLYLRIWAHYGAGANDRVYLTGFTWDRDSPAEDCMGTNLTNLALLGPGGTWSLSYCADVAQPYAVCAPYDWSAVSLDSISESA